MTTATGLKHLGWGKSQPHELARKIASAWGATTPVVGSRGREVRTSHSVTRFAKARGYDRKVRILLAEQASVEIVHERPATHWEEPLQETFDRLRQQWVAETAFVSSTVDIVMNHAYQQIIGLGSPAVPLILRELERNGGQWFWALRMITRQDPVPKELRGKTKRMTEVWITWAKDHHII